MSLSQPCLPVANVGPTRILPHLYLGSQKDVLNKVELCLHLFTHFITAIGRELTCYCYLAAKHDLEVIVSLSLQDLMAQNGITYVLNASNTCPKPDFISESHFMRIPVNDNYCEKLLPWLDKTNEFIGKRRANVINQSCVCIEAED